MVQERRGSFPDKMSPLKPIRTPLVSGDEKAEQEKRDRIQRYKEERRKQMAARYGTNDVSSSDEENTHSSSLGGLYKRRRRPRSGLGPTSDAQNIDGKRLQSSSLEHLKKSHENITSESLSHLRSEPPSAKELLEQSFTSTSTTGTSNNNEIHSLKDEAHFAYNQETTSEPSAQRRSPQEGGRVDSADSTLSGSEGRVGGRRRTSGDEKDKSHKRKSHLNRASTSEEAVYPPGGAQSVNSATAMCVEKTFGVPTQRIIWDIHFNKKEIPRRRRRRTPQGASDSSYTSSPSNTTPDATSRLTPSALAPSDLPGFSVTKGALPPVTPFSSFRNSQGSFSSTLNSRFKESDGALYQEPSKNLQHAKGTQQKTPPLKLGPLRKPEIPDVLRHRESNPAVGSPGVVPANISRPSSVVIEKPPLGLEGNSNIRSSAHRSSVKKSGDASLCFMASRRERKEEEAFPRNGVRSDSPDDVREHLDSLTSQAHDLKSRAETLTGENVFQECEEYLQVNKGFSISRSPSSPPPERRRSEESDESPTEASYPQNDTGVISDSGQKNRPGGPEGSCEGFGRMVLEEKVREGLSGSALSSGSPHLVDNAIIGRKNSLAFRREEDGHRKSLAGNSQKSIPGPSGWRSSPNLEKEK
ncbi:hypothetical protein Avbf_08052 [Armadillidium vulgare]|nr:hypothetical protein Avbf_08052 [Armadillidium vulgare]